ncbi:MAG: hypothetical protein H6716_29725 [Polyangiaceae bacterium]|nr:hypothetical protein [Polyangiaceae bacterium]
MSGTVKVEALQSRSPHQNQALLSARDSNGKPVFSVLEVLPSSQVGETLFGYLRPSASNATANMGEDESLALCMHHKDLTLVSSDKLAVFRAVSELGPNARVMLPFDLWAELRHRGWISHADYDVTVHSSS